MKVLVVILFVVLSQSVHADGIDRIHVLLNGKPIFMTDNSNQKISYSISSGDTLVFDAWTDWDMLEKATLTLKSHSWNDEIKLNQIINNEFGAQFIYIVKEADLMIEFDVFLNYNIPKFEPRYFLSIKKGIIQ
jgi:hypothetical protein